MENNIPHKESPHSTPLKTSAESTLHCLSGCIIGEIAGLMIGVSLGLEAWKTIFLATTLAYFSGFTLGLMPLMRYQKKTMIEALKIIWIGEAISIGVMEIAMNAADYAAGGMHASSIISWQFLFGISVAVPAGFLAAWPVNWYLIKRDLKSCH
tara:strand:+ start:934 stop:1392 length:459 start_codon:yes stop_codon:yes gene_type:complete